MLRYVAGGAVVIGAVILFLDPFRRRTVRDRLAARGRRGAEVAAPNPRGSGTSGLGGTQSLSGGSPAGNDADLADRVRGEVLRDPRMPRDGIEITAAAGVVTLRGEVDGWDHLRDVESRVRRVSGVVGLENLLHLANAPGSAG